MAILDMFQGLRIKREIDIGNAGFEITRGLPTDTTDYLVGWQVYGYAVPQSSVVYSGNYAAAIAGGSYIVNSGLIPVLPGDVIRVSAAMAAEPGITSSNIFIMLYTESALEVVDPSTAYLGTLFSSDFGGNYGWNIFTVDFTIPSPVRFIRIGFICSGSGYLYVDDVNAVLASAMQRVEVTNFPSEYPLPSTQVSDLKNVTIVGDNVGIAKDSTLSDLSSKITKCDTDNVTITSMPPISIEEKGFSDASDTPTRALVDSDRNVMVAINKDNVGLAKESTLSSIDSKITKCDTDNVIATAKLQAYDGSNWKNLMVQDSTYNNLRVTIFDSGTRIESTDYNSDGKAITKAGLLVGCMNFGFNGSSLDRLRTHMLIDLGTFTGTGVSSSVDTVTGFDKWTWQIISDSSGTNMDVKLQGSIDGSHWFDLDEFVGVGNTMRHVVNKPVRYLRANVVSMGDASSISVMVWGIR